MKWNKFLEELPRMDTAPSGFMTLSEAEKQTGRTRRAICKALLSGNISPHECITTTAGRRLRLWLSRKAVENYSRLSRVSGQPYDTARSKNEIILDLIEQLISNLEKNSTTFFESTTPGFGPRFIEAPKGLCNLLFEDMGPSFDLWVKWTGKDLLQLHRQFLAGLIPADRKD